MSPRVGLAVVPQDGKGGASHLSDNWSKTLSSEDHELYDLNNRISMIKGCKGGASPLSHNSSRNLSSEDLELYTLYRKLNHTRWRKRRVALIWYLMSRTLESEYHELYYHDITHSIIQDGRGAPCLSCASLTSPQMRPGMSGSFAPPYAILEVSWLHWLSLLIGTHTNRQKHMKHLCVHTCVTVKINTIRSRCRHECGVAHLHASWRTWMMYGIHEQVMQGLYE